MPKGLQIGLVLQGPTLSKGRHGGTMGTTSMSEVVFDCKPLIEKYSRECERLGVDLVLSTWVGQNVEGLSCPVLQTNIANALPSHAKGTTEPSKYYQAFSTLIGVDFLVDRGASIVIKLRADLDVDLDNLVGQVLDHAGELDRTMLVSFLDPKKPWSLQDFYFAASAEVISHMLEQYVARPEFVRHVHQDYFWQFAREVVRRDIPRLSEFPKFGKPWTQAQAQVCLDNYRCFRPLTRELWTSMCWRGERIGRHGVESADLLQFNGDRESTDQELVRAMRKYFFFARSFGVLNWVLADLGRWISVRRHYGLCQGPAWAALAKVDLAFSRIVTRLH
jgi:hypothetical protein